MKPRKLIYALTAMLMLLATAPRCHAQTAHITGSGVTADGKYTFVIDQTVTLTVVPTTQPTALPATKPATLPVVVVPPPVVPAPAPAPAAPAGRPGAKTTGSTGTLTKAPANFAPKSGQTYKSLIFNDQVNVNGLSNVTFQNCLFDITAVDTKGNRKAYAIRCDTAGTGIKIVNCEMRGMSSAAVYGQNFTATSCYVHDSAGDGFKPTQNVLIQGCYVTRLGMSPGAHADGAQIMGGHDIKIAGNFFDMPVGVAGTSSNSSMFLQKDTKGIKPKNVTFDGNWCLGGNYTVCAYDVDASCNIKVTNNVFYSGSPRYGFGNIFVGVVWAGNVTDGGKTATTSMK